MPLTPDSFGLLLVGVNEDDCESADSEQNDKLLDAACYFWAMFERMTERAKILKRFRACRKTKEAKEHFRKALHAMQDFEKVMSGERPNV